MNSITRFTLAVLAIMMTAVVPQSVQAQTSQRSIPPGISINSSMMRGGTNLSASGINASPFLGQKGEKIVTKAMPYVVYIGAAPLTIPTVADGKMYYYTYTETSGNSVLSLTSSTTEYNVAVSITEDYTLNLTFNDLVVKKSSNQTNDSRGDTKTAVFIYNSGKTVLTLEGESSLTGADNDTSSDRYSFGLYSKGDIEIQGKGKLTVTGGKASGDSKGIDVDGDAAIALDGGSLTATGGESTEDDSFGMKISNSLTITGSGTIEAKGGKATSDSEGIIVNDGGITIDLDGGSLTATGGESTGDESYGMDVTGQLTIKGKGTIKAEGGKASEDSRGMYVYDGGITIDLDGGSLTATGGEATEDSYGMYIYSDSYDLTIKGNGTIIAEGGKAKYYSRGIYVPVGDITIALEGGSLTATGGLSNNSESYGMNCKAINISSGVVTVQGHTMATCYYDGNPLAPTIYSGAIVTAGTEYDGSNAVVYDESQIGTYKYLHVGQADLKNASIDAIPNQDYTGYAITPKPVVKYGDETLVEGKDYTVSYANNIDPGTATVTITGTGNFIGTLTVTFTINPEQATDYAYVNLPFVTGISTNPIAGTYSVTKGESFSFTITLKEGYEESKPIVTANRKEITPNEAGEYVIEKIMENTDITITGITATGVEGISAKTAIWTNGHSLNIRTVRPQQLQVISILGKTAVARNIPAGDTSIGTLSAGVYVVRLADGTMEKVIIR